MWCLGRDLHDSAILQAFVFHLLLHCSSLWSLTNAHMRVLYLNTVGHVYLFIVSAHERKRVLVYTKNCGYVCFIARAPAFVRLFCAFVCVSMCIHDCLCASTWASMWLLKTCFSKNKLFVCLICVFFAKWAKKHSTHGLTLVTDRFVLETFCFWLLVTRRSWKYKVGLLTSLQVYKFQRDSNQRTVAKGL